MHGQHLPQQALGCQTHFGPKLAGAMVNKSDPAKAGRKVQRISPRHQSKIGVIVIPATSCTGCPLTHPR